MLDGVNYDYCEQLEIGDEEQSSDLMQLHQPLTHRIGPLASGPHSAWARLGLGAIMRDTRSPRHVGQSAGGADETRVVT